MRHDLLSAITPYAASELRSELDEHLSALSILFHQYLKHSWVCADRAYVNLAVRHHRGVLMDVNVVARAIVSLGGVPLGSPLEYVNRSYLDHEDEGLYDLPFLVWGDARHEETLRQRLLLSQEAASELGAPGIETSLVNLVTHAAARLERLTRFSDGMN